MGFGKQELSRVIWYLDLGSGRVASSIRARQRRKLWGTGPGLIGLHRKDKVSGKCLSLGISQPWKGQSLSMSART